MLSWIKYQGFLLLLICVLAILEDDMQQMKSVSFQDKQPTYKFQNGKWFNGTDFVERTFYSENGILRSSRPAQVDSGASANGGTIQPSARSMTWNLGILKKHGVRIAIGSDSYGSTGVDEAFQIHDLDIFSNLDLLKIWVKRHPGRFFQNVSWVA